jgi:GPH family glycoside/pentoside/hexuronide:cation symporter
LTSQKLRPFLYGLAELGPASIDIFLKVYLLLYFNIILGLSPSLTSLAIGLGVLWDALLDPWIGIFSDRYYQKNRHRKSVIYAAIFLCVFLFFILWRIPHYSQLSTFLLLFFISSLLNSAISLFSIPYIALANDIEHDNEKRKTWTGWRMAFFNFGSFVGLGVPAYFLTAAAQVDPNAVSAVPYKESTTVLLVIMLICSLSSVYYVYHKQKMHKPDKVAFKHAKFTELIKDKNFLRMMISFFVVNCGLGLNSALALYYYKNYLEFTESQTQIVLISFLFVFTLSIPFWIYMTRHFSKRKLIISSAFLLGCLTIFTFPNYKGIDFWLIVSVASGVGGVLVGVAVVLEIYLSDFIKDKEIKTQQNVSGQYLGVWKMSSKISRAVAIALAGPILEVAHNTQVLANYFGWGVGLFFILAALVMAIPIKAAEL